MEENPESVNSFLATDLLSQLMVKDSQLHAELYKLIFKETIYPEALLSETKRDRFSLLSHLCAQLLNQVTSAPKVFWKLYEPDAEIL